MADCRFRFANENDCRLILKFIRSLAKYEKMEDEVVATEEKMKSSPRKSCCASGCSRRRKRR